MNPYIAALASLGLAILLSPEITVLGLIAASDRRIPRTCAWVFALGAAVGLAFALWIGFMMANSYKPSHTEPTWTGFIVRSVIATLLLAVGTVRMVNAIRHKPVEKTPEQRERSLLHRLKVWFTARFPWVAAIFDGKRDLPPARRAGRWGIIGFAVNGLHPKVFPIVAAAGHEALQMPTTDQRTFGVLLFAAIALVPSVVPAVIETIHPGISSRLKDSFERFMKVNGRWIGACFLVAVALFVAHNAWTDMPGRQHADAAGAGTAPAAATTPAPAAK